MESNLSENRKTIANIGFPSIMVLILGLIITCCIISCFGGMFLFYQMSKDPQVQKNFKKSLVDTYNEDNRPVYQNGVKLDRKLTVDDMCNKDITTEYPEYLMRIGCN